MDGKQASDRMFFICDLTSWFSEGSVFTVYSFVMHQSLYSLKVVSPQPYLPFPLKAVSSQPYNPFPNSGNTEAVYFVTFAGLLRLGVPM